MGLRAAAFLAFLILTACAGAVAVGAGCDAYGEQRRKMPSDEALAASPPEVFRWINALDAAMTSACHG